MYGMTYMYNMAKCDSRVNMLTGCRAKILKKNIKFGGCICNNHFLILLIFK